MSAFDDYIGGMDMRALNIQQILNKWNGRVLTYPIVIMNRRIFMFMLMGLVCGMVLKKIIEKRRHRP